MQAVCKSTCSIFIISSCPLWKAPQPDMHTLESSIQDQTCRHLKATGCATSMGQTPIRLELKVPRDVYSVAGGCDPVCVADAHRQAIQQSLQTLCSLHDRKAVRPLTRAADVSHSTQSGYLPCTRRYWQSREAHIIGCSSISQRPYKHD